MKLTGMRIFGFGLLAFLAAPVALLFGHSEYMSLMAIELEPKPAKVFP
jgi:hypothetical protein